MPPLLEFDLVTSQAQSILDAFYNGVVACGREPSFKPSIVTATTPDATRYDPPCRAVILVPYKTPPPPRRAAMDRFAAIGTLGLSGREQYIEVFNNLLVAHELGRWLQKIAQPPLNRRQAEYQENQFCRSIAEHAKSSTRKHWHERSRMFQHPSCRD